MITLRARFDGRVLVPGEPVNLPTGRALQLQIREIGKLELETMPEIEPFDHDPVTGLPFFRAPPDALAIATEDIRRAEV